MTAAVKAVLAAVLLSALAGLGLTIYALGRSNEKAESVQTTAKAGEVAQGRAKTKVRADMQRAADSGKAREQDRAALDTYFQQLDREAKDAPTAAHDDYVLPDERLRLWRAANAGRTDPGSTGSEPDSGAPTVAATSLGANPGVGDQSQGRGEGLSPARIADVPAAGLPADQARGL